MLEVELQSRSSTAVDKTISLRHLFIRFRWRILFTWLLVFMESIIYILLPFFMGNAIDDLIQKEYQGLWVYAGMAVFMVFAGGARRFYDTRLYSRVYSIISPEMIEKEKKRDAPDSVIAARTKLLTEFVAYFETSFPRIVDGVVAQVGVLPIILLLEPKVFAACLAATGLVALLYAFTGRRIYRLNRGFNDELERQVAVVSANDKAAIVSHFKRLIGWKIGLSDLDTLSYGLSWLFLFGMTLYAIIITVHNGASTQGQVFSVLMYVLHYSGHTLAMPVFYQQFVRLREISHRLEYDESLNGSL